MELLIAILVGILFAVGVYMMLSHKLLKIIIGTAFLSHGTLLMLMTVGKLKRGAPPIIVDGVEDAVYVDPIPQALILTAIVIGFATTAFSLVLAYRCYQELGTDETEQMRGDFTDEH